jgi:hypothetical protein
MQLFNAFVISINLLIFFKYNNQIIELVKNDKNKLTLSSSFKLFTIAELKR